MIIAYILIIILALVLFGGGKLAGIGKALGRSITDFKNEIKDVGDNKKESPEMVEEAKS